MAKRKKSIEGMLKLLEAWEAPEDAGEPIGCVATSYTFEPAFFEEECLSRFLRIDANPVEDGLAYILDREEKLSQVSFAGVMVDQAHARGPRSPRWDLIPVRVLKGVMHAKVSLLVWEKLTRLIVTSANITDNGYRKNIEKVAVLDFDSNSNTEFPATILTDTIQFLRQILAFTAEAQIGVPVAARLNGFLDHSQRIAGTISAKQLIDPNLVATSAKMVFVTPQSTQDVLTQVFGNWPTEKNPPRRAVVFSPFYDDDDKKNEPVRRLWAGIAPRAETSVHFVVCGEETPDGKITLNAPRSLIEEMPNSPSGNKTTEIEFANREQNGESRPLHGKAIYLSNDGNAAFLLGSSNFTSAGLGIIGPYKRRNFEANVLFSFDLAKHEEEDDAIWRVMNNVATKVVEQSEEDKIVWKKSVNLDEGGEDESQIIPQFFISAVLKVSADRDYTVELLFGDFSPQDWRIYCDRNDPVALFDVSEWRKQGEPSRISLNVKGDAPISTLFVQFDAKSFEWPVNVEHAATLPPPPEMRNLTLDELITILVSARPLHEVLRKIRRRDRSGSIEPTKELLDPHSRVDTSKFLLQRTRKVSAAISVLRERLSQPCGNVERLRWRLSGPAGVLAVVNAIRREAISDSETAFLLAELYFELSSVSLRADSNSISEETFKAELGRVLSEIRTEIDSLLKNVQPSLAGYIKLILSGQAA